MAINGSMTQKNKADLFAKTFEAKAKLPAESVDCPFFGRPDVEYDEFVALRTRYTLKILKGLDESKATGPDCIPVLFSNVLRTRSRDLLLSCAGACCGKLAGLGSGAYILFVLCTNVARLFLRAITGEFTSQLCFQKLQKEL